jgi:hypothetical protein
MSHSKSYTFDVFISHKSEDLRWALKLRNSLQDKGFKVFVDEKDLLSGSGWERQLGETLQNSHHLVVLWSNEADHSQWVRREIAHFETRVYSPTPDDTRIIFILLEGDNSAYSSFQMISELKTAGAYDTGINQLNSNLRSEVVDKTRRAIESTDTSKPVSLLIMAMTNDRIKKIEPTLSFPGGFKSLNTLLEDFGMETIKTRDDLAQYYGDHPKDWRPFGSTDSIWTIMDSLKDEINRIQSNHIRWELIGDDFWSANFEAAKKEAEKLISDWAVIIIDPLSFYDTDISYRFNNYIYQSFENAKAVFLALPPFSILSPYFNFRTTMQRIVSRIFDHFYDPPIINGTACAKCNINIANEQDIKQCLLTSIGAGFITERPEPKNVVLHL